MAIYILGPDQNGDCCTCAERVNVCDTCVPPVIDFTCRIKGGTVSLCGFNEYTSPSSPPKRYRTETANGSSATCVYHGAGCNPPDFFESDEYAFVGSRGYDISCSYSTSATQTFSQGFISCGTYENIEVTPWNGGLIAFAPATFNTTRTLNQITSTPGCHAQGVNSTNSNGTVESQLSDEDTDADVIARVIASPWSAWFGGNCTAGWSIRISGYSFVYQEAEWRVEASGLIPSHNYDLTINIYRRPTGGVYSLYDTVTTTHASSVSGTIDVIDTVPNAQGYETYVDSNVILIPS